ncbi:hypothetical protein RZP54_27285 [Raoultella ornithinolytica]|uniref:hypothetical protein n=1 Tax=Raoultella ornithinolytica TaxID=54291 RepID=UPI000CF337C8|nr:hypothetical protein [Raoultella ornithinolytica]MDV0592644.1 hypothetical protein [Raoultella ornithinolytica]PQH11431.1 hypothetical protein C5T92_29175 [Raoultella ornithinolytica]RVS21173.1 hypothetical protein EOL18_04255 [Raoultella ornithinolytica]
MTAKFETSFCIEAPTVNGYPSVGTLCVIEGNNSLVAHIFVEPDGKLVISTNMPEVIDIRHEEVRKCLPKGDYHLLPKATEQRKTLKINHCIHLEPPEVGSRFSNGDGGVMYPRAPLDKNHRYC